MYIVKIFTGNLISTFHHLERNPRAIHRSLTYRRTMIIISLAYLLHSTDSWTIKKSARKISMMTRYLSDHPLLAVHPVRLRPQQLNSPFCYALTVDPTFSSTVKTKSSFLPYDSSYNFLATQVWPASRVAASVLQSYFLSLLQSNKTIIASHPPITKTPTESSNITHIYPCTVCEFGCGPGLPSLTIAKVVHDALLNDNNKHSHDTLAPPPIHVVATDIDPMALQLVSQAAKDQNLTSKFISTERFDLLSQPGEVSIPQANLYILCDVFESKHVIQGAARIIHSILYQQPTSSLVSPPDLLHKRQVWIFCQSDRIQKETFIEEFHNVCRQYKESLFYHPQQEVEDDDDNWEDIQWEKLTLPLHSNHLIPSTKRLWLCEFDELIVPYT